MPQSKNLELLYSKLDYEISTNLVAANANNEKAELLMDMRVKEAQELITDFIIDKTDVNGLIFNFTRLATKTGVSNFSAYYDPDSSYRTVSGFDYLLEGNIRLKFNADYKEFALLINELETYKPVVFIDRFDISSPKMGQSKNNINVVLTFYTDKK